MGIVIFDNILFPLTNDDNLENDFSHHGAESHLNDVAEIYNITSISISKKMFGYLTDKSDNGIKNRRDHEKLWT